MVRNAAWWLQDFCGMFCLSFLTATLPDEAIDLMESRGTFSKDWSEIIQEKRWQQSGKVGLHLHWVFQGRPKRNSNWAISKEEFAEAWLRIVSNVVGQKVESKSATRIERVKKSVENYLSKYMSKGGKVIDEIVAAGKLDQLPTAWWNVTNALKTIIRKAIKPISDEAKDCLFEGREDLKNQGIIQWFYVHEIDYVEPHGEARKVPVAFIGKFAKPEFADMFDY
jgi:hypothetical protein